jgi:hypothetical protein
MPLEIQKGRSRWFYGRVGVDGRQLCRNLGVEIKGTPPASLRDLGDAAFERSRAKAQAVLEHLQADLKKRSTSEELVQAIHEIRTGGRIRSASLSDCAKKWEELPRCRPLNERYLKQALSRIAAFVKFVGTDYPRVREMAGVQSHIAREFMKKEQQRGIAPKTYNSLLILMRSIFHALRRDAGMPENPFDGIPTLEADQIFRKPFSAEELGLIVAAAKADQFIYPAIIVGICTAISSNGRRSPCGTLFLSVPFFSKPERILGLPGEGNAAQRKHQDLTKRVDFLWWILWLCSQEIATVRGCSPGRIPRRGVSDIPKIKQLTEVIP